MGVTSCSRSPEAQENRRVTTVYDARAWCRPREPGSSSHCSQFPDSLFKAVCSGEHPAMVEQAPSASVACRKAQAGLPRPAPAKRVFSAYYERADVWVATRCWDGQRTPLSCRKQASCPPSLTRKCEGKGLPGKLHKSRGHAGEEEGNVGDPPHVVHRRPPLPPGAHQLHVSNDEFWKPGVREMKR